MTTLLPALPLLAACATGEGIDIIGTDHTIDAGLCQSAAHATRLAIARWRQGLALSEMQVAGALRASAQERWYAHTLTDFNAWRASGGFGQDQQRKVDETVDDKVGEKADAQ